MGNTPVEIAGDKDWERCNSSGRPRILFHKRHPFDSFDERSLPGIRPNRRCVIGWSRSSRSGRSRPASSPARRWPVLPTRPPRPTSRSSSTRPTPSVPPTSANLSSPSPSKANSSPKTSTTNRPTLLSKTSNARKHGSLRRR